MKFRASVNSTSSNREEYVGLISQIESKISERRNEIYARDIEKIADEGKEGGNRNEVKNKNYPQEVAFVRRLRCLL